MVEPWHASRPGTRDADRRAVADQRPDLRRRLSVRVAVAIGMLVIAAGGALALVGSIRLGIGRHGAAWWRPFQNALTPAHVQNLAVFTSGVVMIAAGAVLSVSPLVRHMRRRI